MYVLSTEKTEEGLDQLLGNLYIFFVACRKFPDFIYFCIQGWDKQIKKLAKIYLCFFFILNYSLLNFLFCLDDDKNVERMDKLKDHMQENEVRMKKVNYILQK